MAEIAPARQNHENFIRKTVVSQCWSDPAMATLCVVLVPAFVFPVLHRSPAAHRRLLSSSCNREQT